MTDKFRIITLSKIASKYGICKDTIISNNTDVKKLGGPLADLVKNTLTPSDFKQRFLELGPGPEREKLVYEEILKRKPFGKMVPITVPGPKGTKITYKVMPDYVTIDGLRVPMSGMTAQKVAEHFGLVLPTAKMSQQTYQASNVKIRPQPLSAGGKIGDKYYSGKEVVEHKIGDSDSAVAYSEMIENELSNKDLGEDDIVGGHMKDILQPFEDDASSLYLGGWQGEDENPLQPYTKTPHDTSVHAEYGTSARFAANDVVVTMPDGKEIKTTFKNLLNSPVFYKAVSDTPGLKKYKI